MPLLWLVLGWEGSLYVRRAAARQDLYNRARLRSRILNKPLLVLGAPDRAITSNYDCGDICADIGPSKCPNSVQFDACKTWPYPDSSAVVYISCTAEYVWNLEALVKEAQRVSGGELYVVRVEPQAPLTHVMTGSRRMIPKEAFGRAREVF